MSEATVGLAAEPAAMALQLSFVFEESSIPVVPRVFVDEEIPDDSEDFPSQPEAGDDSDLWLYRDRTSALLRRYLRFSIEVGRLPSLLGRELFRSRVTSYRAATFEDAVIFVHDVQKCLAQLDEFEKKLIARVVFQDYTQDEAARLMGVQRKTVGRRYPETLDRLSGIFLDDGLLAPLPTPKIMPPKSCQEGKTSQNELSDC